MRAHGFAHPDSFSPSFSVYSVYSVVLHLPLKIKPVSQVFSDGSALGESLNIKSCQRKEWIVVAASRSPPSVAARRRNHFLFF